MVPAMEPRAFYIADDERLIPTAYARGPWDPRLQHGGPPSAAIARACARRLDDPAWSLSRISYDLQRPILLAPMSITLEEGLSTRATRRLIAHLTIDGREVIRAHALFVRREALTLPPLPPPAATLPPPEQCEALLVPFASGPVGFAHALELRRARGEYGRGPLAAWSRFTVALIAGEPWSPESRAAAIADGCNGLSPIVDPTQFTFINADLALHLHRPPEGEWLGIDASTALEDHGLGLAHGRLHDRRGPFGLAVQDLVVRAAFV
jgi:hypothetical protein